MVLWSPCTLSSTASNSGMFSGWALMVWEKMTNVFSSIRLSSGGCFTPRHMINGVWSPRLLQHSPSGYYIHIHSIPKLTGCVNLIKGHGNLNPYMHVISVRVSGFGIMPVSATACTRLQPFNLETNLTSYIIIYIPRPNKLYIYIYIYIYT